jgi:dsRNA-specific ribonuclease
MLTIKEVRSARDVKEFIEFPLRLYKKCPHFVPPLYGDEKNKRKGKMSSEKAELESNCVFHAIMENEKLLLYSYNDTHFHMDNPPKHKKVVTKKHDPYIEAIAASIFMDGGWESVTSWFENWLFPRLKEHNKKP